MTCTKCHTEFAWGDVLQMDIESCTWVHESCPQDVYNVDDMRSIAAHYATYIRDQMDVAEAQQFADGHYTDGDIIIAHALGVRL